MTTANPTDTAPYSPERHLNGNWQEVYPGIPAQRANYHGTDLAKLVVGPTEQWAELYVAESHPVTHPLPHGNLLVARFEESRNGGPGTLIVRILATWQPVSGEVYIAPDLCATPVNGPSGCVHVFQDFGDGSVSPVQILLPGRTTLFGGYRIEVASEATDDGTSCATRVRVTTGPAGEYDPLAE
ncbi:MAG TPA: hypothetical protein VMT30_09075 [Candidatus Saccharimonadia bacterium]|nr:hypothetical protein [Candidatus Saccharimonadia bacterium]